MESENKNKEMRKKMQKEDMRASISFHLVGKEIIDYIFTKQFQDNQSLHYKNSSININATSHNQ